MMYNIVPRPVESVVNGVPITLHKNHPNLRSRRKKERTGARVSLWRTRPFLRPLLRIPSACYAGYNHPGKNLVHKHKTLEFGVLGEQPATRYIQITWT